MHHLFSCTSENSLLGQVELRACAFLENLTGDCFFTHAWSPQCVFFRDGKFFQAGGILSLCKFSLKMRLDIFLLRTHGVHNLFSCVMENSWLRQVQF